MQVFGYADLRTMTLRSDVVVHYCALFSYVDLKTALLCAAHIAVRQVILFGYAVRLSHRFCLREPNTANLVLRLQFITAQFSVTLT